MQTTRLMFTLPLVISLLLALTQPIYYTKAVTKTDIQNLFISNSHLNDELSKQLNKFAKNPKESTDKLNEVLKPLCASENILVKSLCSLLATETGQNLATELLKGLSTYLESMPDEDQKQMQKFIADQIYTLISASNNNLLKDDARNILSVIQSLQKSNETLLAIIVAIFCVLMPITKVLYFAFYPLTRQYFSFFKWIPAKFSMLEVFVTSLIILSIQTVPLISVQIGYVAVLGYTLFALTAIIADKVLNDHS